MKLVPNKQTTQLFSDFAGGSNYYLGPRQVKDNESPDAINCDFKGRSGVGNRDGFTQIGAVADSRTAIYGMAEFHTTTLDQLIKFASNGSNVALYHSTGGAWTAVTGTTFTDAKNMDVMQAAIMASASTPGTPVSTIGYLFSFNGTDTMSKFDGSVWSAHTGGTKGYYGAFFDERLWCVDDQYPDTLNFSTKTPDASKCLDFTANGTSSNPGTITFKPGAGVKIRGMISFKNALYVFLYPFGIYKIETTATVNTFTVTLITNAVGCVSHRSIAQVGEDIFFAGDNGIYSLGDVANYTAVRTTNKSARMQQIFDGLSGTNKQKLVGKFFNFKYHLFYSLYGTDNDSCAVYDIRYQAWQDWRGIAANAATLYTDANGDQGLYFGEPTTGKIHQMYSGSTDDGKAITSYWKSKSFDMGAPDLMKLFMDTTWIFGSLNGSVTLKVIFDETEISASKTLSQGRPQGGFGRDVFGSLPFGDATNTETIISVIGTPQRMEAKGQKFAVQYYIYSQSGSWRLDGISQMFIPFDRWKFPSENRIE